MILNSTPPGTAAARTPRTTMMTTMKQQPRAKSLETYGMDQNSDDSTDDESKPRKPIPSWAREAQLMEALRGQYRAPPDLDVLFGAIPAPMLEEIFNQRKTHYLKRTSSAVWHSPPLAAGDAAGITGGVSSSSKFAPAFNATTAQGYGGRLANVFGKKH
uniref:Inner centromere protein A-like n=1 Tax=Petromyzon marinus TaxID=7757 RepID=A0AAJ7UJG8_PETMA|nr:inner centromere protein A-like [Petromyzon marinus]